MICWEGNGGGVMVGRTGGPGRQGQDYSESGIALKLCTRTYPRLQNTNVRKPYSTTLSSRFTSTRLPLSHTTCAHQHVPCTVLRDSQPLKPPSESILTLGGQIEV